jgi:hypothetical protein
MAPLLKGSITATAGVKVLSMEILRRFEGESTFCSGRETAKR